jgi:uncharacterized membrane protein YhhN
MVNVETREVRVSGADGPVRTHAVGFAALWLLWLVMLAGAMISGNVLEGHSKALPTALRMGSSVVLVITAWWAWTLWRKTTAGRFAILIAIGMTLGTIGDFFNADLLKFIPIHPPVLGGIAAFGLGHIAYITGCIDLARRAGLTNRNAFLIGIVGWQLIGLIGWYYVAYLGTENRGLIWPALPYSLLLAGTAGIASGLALQQAKLFPLALGGALFLLSDLILAFGMFGEGVKHGTEAVWLTYGPGQMLIVFSILSAVALLFERARRQA